MPKRLRKHLPELLIGFGLFFLLVNAVHVRWRDRSLNLEKQMVEEITAKSEQERLPLPKHIFIRWFIDTDISDAIYTGKKWTVSPDNASYLLQSARPGEPGNVIIYGHNTREILGNIRALKGGETVTVTTEDGKEHLYTVTETHEVEPSNVEFLKPTETEVLTMYTCSGFLDKQRFIVRALPFNDK